MPVEITLKGDTADLKQIFALMAGSEVDLKTSALKATPKAFIMPVNTFKKRGGTKSRGLSQDWKERALKLANKGEPFKLAEVCPTNNKRIKAKFTQWLEKTLGCVVEAKDPNKPARSTNPYIVLPKPLDTSKTPPVQEVPLTPEEVGRAEAIVRNVLTEFGNVPVTPDTPGSQSGTALSQPHTGLSARSIHHIPESVPVAV